MSYIIHNTDNIILQHSQKVIVRHAMRYLQETNVNAAYFIDYS